PAMHYLRYGAAMGRNPGKGFDTQFYLTTYPDAAESGLNPLLHYVLHGRDKGYATRKRQDDVRSWIGVIRNKLLSLGFTDKPLEELREILDINPDPVARTLAARELALWHMREKTEEGYRATLGYLAQARAQSPALDVRSKLATIELLCHYFLGDTAAGLAAYDRIALAGEVTPDALLARVNFETTAEGRIAWINQVLRHYGISPVALLPDEGQPFYDRLTSASVLPEVTEGPKVTVLIAAYEAGDTLPTTLRSLQEQTWKNLEILVLDDCSPTPGTCEAAERFAATDPRIRLIRMEENGGAYVARNRGLDEATGEFVTIHDADDWSHPMKIETQVRFLMENAAVMGCTSQQARVYSDLSFCRWSGSGIFLFTNTSSFMFRREPIREQLGYWDTVRFAADNELVRRIMATWRADAVCHIPTGPLSFQRDSDTSIVADSVLGINGMSFGVRRHYLQAQQLHHRSGAGLRYGNDRKQRPFPAPLIMNTGRGGYPKDNHYPVIIASEFRLLGGNSHSNAQELISQKRAGIRSAIMQMYRYDVEKNLDRPIQPEVWNEVDGKTVDLLAYGEHATCDLLIVRYPPVLYRRNRFMPQVTPREIKVIINQPPMSDYTSQGIVRYELADCAENIRHYFGKDATWHPIGPLVRDALHEHHADTLHHINLSDEDWNNIIDIAGWHRGPRRRGPQDRLRIGRHSRDHEHKWPDTREDVLAAYPAADDVEVHVLGGASAPAALIGAVPGNWVVHEFGSRHPRDFLADIDVFVYFAHPDWVESFGRTIIEAMAVGVPVILPEIYRPLFGDAALYATTQTAVDMARKLHADSAAYDAQVARALESVRSRFSYETHLNRLAQSGIHHGNP
nr:glycosyltransferase [Paracoccaceae bacterium]